MPSLFILHDQRARRKVGPDAHAVFRNLPAKPQHSFALARSGARQTYVRCLDAETLHEVKNLQLGFNRRIGDGGALQAVAQGLIVNHDVAGPVRPARALLGPVVDEALLFRSVHDRLR